MSIPYRRLAKTHLREAANAVRAERHLTRDPQAFALVAFSMRVGRASGLPEPAEVAAALTTPGALGRLARLCRHINSGLPLGDVQMAVPSDLRRAARLRGDASYLGLCIEHRETAHSVQHGKCLSCSTVAGVRRAVPLDATVKPA